jgi:parallel beta-helix repeat protein
VTGPTYSSGFSIDGQSNVVVNATNFTNPSGACLTITNSSNVTVTGASFINCYGPGIDVENSTNITIEHNYFENINHGVFALGGSSIVVDYNNFKNLVFYTDNSPHFVIFDQVNGGVNDISFNRGINVQGQSSPEDLINMYQSSGTSANPIMIQGNCFEGGGPSTSGGGILAGDSAGSFIVVQNNTLVNAGQYGIAVSVGSNNQILNNTIFAQQEPWTNVGMYCNHGDSNVFSGNQVDYTNSSGQANPWWGGGCSNTTLSSNDFSTSLASLSCSLY